MLNVANDAVVWEALWYMAHTALLRGTSTHSGCRPSDSGFSTTMLTYAPVGYIRLVSTGSLAARHWRLLTRFCAETCIALCASDHLHDTLVNKHFLLSVTTM